MFHFSRIFRPTSLLFILLVSPLFSPALNAQVTHTDTRETYCTDWNFCSEYLVNKFGGVILSHPDQLGPRINRGDHFYVAFAGDPRSGRFGIGETRDNDRIQFINGPNEYKGFVGAYRAETQAKQNCAPCEVVLSFRNGCGAIAYSAKNNRFYTKLQEYQRGFRGARTSGDDPNLAKIKERLYNECSDAGCVVLDAVCTRDPWN